MQTSGLARQFWKDITAEVQFLRPLSPETFDTAYGSAFVLNFGGRRWLITCAHNLEDREKDLKAQLDFPLIRIIQPSPFTLDANDGRAVIFARVDGEVADCAAIELLPDDGALGLSALYTGDLESNVAFVHEVPVDTVVMTSPAQGVRLDVDGLFMAAGFTGGATGRQPVTVVYGKGIRGLPLPKPWMIAFAPGGAKGMSGGPLLQALGPAVIRLVGIYTHQCRPDLKVCETGSEGIWITLEGGAGVRIQALLTAMSQAVPGGGVQVFDVNPTEAGVAAPRDVTCKPVADELPVAAHRSPE